MTLREVLLGLGLWTRERAATGRPYAVARWITAGGHMGPPLHGV